VQFEKDIDIPIEDAGGSKGGEVRPCGGSNTFFDRLDHRSSFSDDGQRRH